MLRLILIAALGYATYRVARQVYRQAPDDFEPVGLLPPPVKKTANI
jgi:hypothetical protein